MTELWSIVDRVDALAAQGVAVLVLEVDEAGWRRLLEEIQGLNQTAAKALGEPPPPEKPEVSDVKVTTAHGQVLVRRAGRRES